MTSRKRVQRPRPQRTGPIRDWQGLLRTPPPQSEEAAEPSEDAVSRGVRLAYQVAQDKLEEGRRQARQHNDRPYGAWTMNGGQQDPTMRLWATANEMTRSWMSMWMNTMGSLGSSWMRTPNPWSAFGSMCGAGYGEQVGFSTELSGAEGSVSITVEPGIAADQLDCPGLTPHEEKGKTISNIVFTQGEGRELARVKIDADGAKKGKYSGAILERCSKRPVGALSVEITG